MKSNLFNLTKKVVRKVGFDIMRYSSSNQTTNFPPDFETRDIDIINTVQSFTLTSPERIHSLCAAVRYIVSNEIPGDIVECGVWKGGSIMAILLTLLELEQSNRHIHLFDTFEGMTKPSKEDVSIEGKVALSVFKAGTESEADLTWVCSPIEEVKKAVYSTGYPQDKIHFVKGKVENTLPVAAPETISLLRLDTDWYESTLHELIHLFPRLCSGGVIIIDDYGHWQGARKATNEYIQENNIKIFLNRIDYTGRIAIKI